MDQDTITIPPKSTKKSKNIQMSIQDFLLQKEKENKAVVSARTRNLFTLNYLKTKNLDEAWRMTNGN